MRAQKSAITITTEDLVTVVEAAKLLGKHITTIYRWVEAGDMVAVKFSGIMFIPTSEVERWKRKMNEAQRDGS